MSAVMSPAVINSVVAYEAMCFSIGECESLADCKDIADKSAALKEYARRLKNTEAERRAANVRLIAERRYGELLALLARATPQTANLGGANQHRSLPAVGADQTPYARALAETGVSTQAASRYQALATVPDEIFDAAIRDPEAIPTLRAVVTAARDAPVKQMPADSLWIWGRMRDFERDGYANKSIDELLAPMTETMRRDVARLAGPMLEFFTKLSEANYESA